MNTDEQLQQAIDALIKFTEDEYSKKTAIHINDLVRRLREETSVLIVKLDDVNNGLGYELIF